MQCIPPGNKYKIVARSRPYVQYAESRNFRKNAFPVYEKNTVSNREKQATENAAEFSNLNVSSTSSR
jgi:hypothetical protein